MLNKLLKKWTASPSVREAFDAPEKGVTCLYDMADGQRAAFTAALARHTGRQVLYVAPSDAQAMRAADDISAWLEGGAAYLPVGDTSFTRGTASREGAFRRLSVLQHAHRGEIRVLCVSADSLLMRMMPPFASRTTRPKGIPSSKGGGVTSPSPAHASRESVTVAGSGIIFDMLIL